MEGMIFMHSKDQHRKQHKKIKNSKESIVKICSLQRIQHIGLHTKEHGFLLTYSDMRGRIFLKTDHMMYTRCNVYAGVTTLERFSPQSGFPAVHDRNINEHNEKTCRTKEENVKVTPFLIPDKQVWQLFDD
jgi:hypothetical protein